MLGRWSEWGSNEIVLLRKLELGRGQKMSRAHDMHVSREDVQ